MIKKDFSLLRKMDDDFYYGRYKNYGGSDKRFFVLRNALDLPWDHLETNTKIYEQNGKVEISSQSFIKDERISLDYDDEKYADLCRKYDKYFDKRFEEIPKLHLLAQDWSDFKAKYSLLREQRPKIMMFTIDSSGETDKVDVVAQEDFSKEDIAYIEQDNDKFLRYEAARTKYECSHSDHSEVWRGPQDDEYEADIMQYYDQVTEEDMNRVRKRCDQGIPSTKS